LIYSTPKEDVKIEAVVKDKGRISRIQAENKAEAEYVIALAHLGDLE